MHVHIGSLKTDNNSCGKDRLDKRSQNLQKPARLLDSTGLRYDFGEIELEMMMVVMIADELIVMILTMTMIIVMKMAMVIGDVQ